MKFPVSQFSSRYYYSFSSAPSTSIRLRQLSSRFIIHRSSYHLDTDDSAVKWRTEERRKGTDVNTAVIAFLCHVIASVRCCCPSSVELTTEVTNQTYCQTDVGPAVNSRLGTWLDAANAARILRITRHVWEPSVSSRRIRVELPGNLLPFSYQVRRHLLYTVPRKLEYAEVFVSSPLHPHVKCTLHQASAHLLSCHRTKLIGPI
jgi:hypothetical protein